MVLKKIVVITGDTISAKMAGPAIRAMEISTILAQHAEVTLVSTSSAQQLDVQFPIFSAKGRVLKQLVSQADVIIFQGFVLAQNPWISNSGKLLIADLYDPMHLEQLEDTAQESAGKKVKAVANTVAVISDQLRKSDHFICATEKQRDLWLGHLSALGRVNPLTYDQDSSLRKLIDVVPFGISEHDPVQSRHAIKGEIEGISSEDKVILWGGGIYNWFDPLTLIRAIELLSTKRPNVKLFFLGVSHPNPVFPEFAMSRQAQQLSNELGLTDKNVFFNQDWVDYEDRVNYLLDADLGVSTHFDHLETAFSFRTRILDYLWARLPIVTTEGDSFGDYVTRHSLGISVPPEDQLALADALETLLFDEEVRTKSIQQVSEFRNEFVWSKATLPLLKMCLNQEHAPDLVVGLQPIPRKFVKETWLRGKIRGLFIVFREGGFKAVLSRISKGE